ncbi:MAG: uroporphyrinogen-III synthase [Magnetococcales bacterium]|nr:uroporphyrinogen-III synthase [Magnetococcales bacterium]
MSPMIPPSQIDLTGRTLLITRPQPEGGETAKTVAACGGRALLAPALTIEPPRDPNPLKRVMADLNGYQGILLTSANGARAFLEHRPIDRPLPPLYAVGPKTARILQKAGLPVTTPSRPMDGERLARAILDWNGGGGRFLFLRAEKGREELISELEGGGAQVDLVVGYRAEPIREIPEGVLQALLGGEVDGVAFFSSRSVAAFVEVLPEAGKEALANTTLAAISAITGKAMTKLGFTPRVVPEKPTAEDLLQALADYWQSRG